MRSSPVNRFSLAEHKIAAIVLAAGIGARMGLGVAKLLLPLADGRPILAHAVEGALALQPLQTLVVVRPDLPALVDALSGLPVECVPNPRYAQGMGTSIAAGAAALGSEARGVMVFLGDQPHVPPHIVRRVVQSHISRGAAITLPMYGGEPGPPSLFSHEVFVDLAGLEGDQGGKALASRYPERVQRITFGARERPLDIDTSGDYERMRP